MPLESIHPDPNGHFLVTESGEPFFWLGDTVWELFHRLNRAEAERYLEVRRQQGFNGLFPAGGTKDSSGFALFPRNGQGLVV